MESKKKRNQKKSIVNIWKNTTKAQRDAELTKTDTEGDKKKGDRMEGGQIRGSFTNQH